MNPPLRSPEHQRALWEGIADGTVDCIATDHAPHTREEKTSGEPLQAPSGVPGVATMLPLMLSVAAGKWPHPTSPSPLSGLSFGYSDLVRLSFTRPNQIFSLHQESIAKLAPARLLLIDPAASSVLHAGMLQSKCAWTPFEGWNVTGGIVRLFA